MFANHNPHMEKSSARPAAPDSPLTMAPKSRSQPHTWTAKAEPQITNQDKNAMWTSTAAVVVSSPTLFSNPHAEPWVRKRRADSGVEMEDLLESGELWTNKWSMLESPKMWLVNAERKNSKVQFRY